MIFEVYLSKHLRVTLLASDLESLLGLKKKGDTACDLRFLVSLFVQKLAGDTACDW